LGALFSFSLTDSYKPSLILRLLAAAGGGMFPDFPEKLLWILGVLSTVAVMATRAHAGL
jgi:hypothetical protein